MITRDQSQILAVLRRRQETIAQQWYRAILQTSFSQWSLLDIDANLSALTDQVITVLLTEPLDCVQAQAIGATLVRLHYLQPEALGNTLEVLAYELIVDLSPEQIMIIYPQLVTLLGALATGFCLQAWQAILAEQEQVRNALLAERTQIIAALRASEERLRTVVHNAPMILFALERNGVFTLVEGKGLETLGWSAQEFIGRSVFEIAGTLPEIADHIRHALTGEAFTAVINIANRVLETHYAPLRDRYSGIQGVLCIAIDITERTRAEVDLAAARRRLTERAEAEHLHLARELHDSAVQNLLSISYQIAAVQRFADMDQLNGASSGEDLRPALTLIQQEVMNVVGQLRLLIGTLRPAGLEELGLTAALEEWVGRLQEKGPGQVPKIKLDLDQSGTVLPEAIALCLFRSAQEAIRNAVHHAEARQITVTLRMQDHKVRLQVQDDGCGFEVPARLSTLTRRNHFGLVGISERVAWVNGDYRIQSQPGQGTVVTVSVPLRRGVSDNEQNNSRDTS